MTSGAELVTTLLTGYNSRDLRRVASSYSPDATVHHDGWDAAVEVPAWLDAFAMMVTSFPDLTLTPEHVAVGHETVIMELRLTGTNSGPLHLGDLDRLVLHTNAVSLPPTGRAIDITGTVVLETSDGQVMAERHYWRLLDSLSQLGLVETRVATGPLGPDPAQPKVSQNVG